MLEPRYSSPVPSDVGLANAAALGERAAALLSANTNGNHHHGLHVSNETAVDLSRKSYDLDQSERRSLRRRRSLSEADAEDSDEEAPLDLKVRPGNASGSRGSGENLTGFSSLPGPQQRAELLKIAEMYTSAPPANLTPLPISRDNSQERGKA